MPVGGSSSLRAQGTNTRLIYVFPKNGLYHGSWRTEVLNEGIVFCIISKKFTLSTLLYYEGPDKDVELTS